MRLIDADALKEKVFQSSADAMNYKAKTAVNRMIDKAPTIDAVEVVRQAIGHWDEDDDGIWCSNCKAFLYFDENLKQDEKFYDYCPECGARMDMCNGRV